MATNNMLHTLNLDFFNDLLANQIFFLCQLFTGY
jgi:hypothetical protein